MTRDLERRFQAIDDGRTRVTWSSPHAFNFTLEGLQKGYERGSIRQALEWGSRRAYADQVDGLARSAKALTVFHAARHLSQHGRAYQPRHGVAASPGPHPAALIAHAHPVVAAGQGKFL